MVPIDKIIYFGVRGKGFFLLLLLLITKSGENIVKII
jgi:hypothetical protein